MSVQTRKICLLGDFGVGKTSLAARFIANQFSDKYLTTVGVKVDTKAITLDSGLEIKLVIWDIAGSDGVTAAHKAYLKGTAGYLLVSDGTRAYTLDNALKLQNEVINWVGEVPFVGLLNKADLVDDWEIPDSRIEELSVKGASWYKTSAKSGDFVEQAFVELAQRLV